MLKKLLAGCFFDSIARGMICSALLLWCAELIQGTLRLIRLIILPWILSPGADGTGNPDNVHIFVHEIDMIQKTLACTASWISRWDGWGATAAGLLVAGSGIICIHAFACRRDRECHFENRWESLWKLRESDSPVRAVQYTESSLAWERVPRRLRWKPQCFAVAGALILGATLFLQPLFHREISASGILPDSGADSGGTDGSGKKKEENDPEKERRSEELMNASITFLYPGGDEEFSPIDLLEWEGFFSGNVTWRDLVLEVSLNGVEAARFELQAKTPEENGGKKELLSSAAARRSGKKEEEGEKKENGQGKWKNVPSRENGAGFSLEGEFSLEEIRAMPLDLLSLRLRGVALSGEEELPVQSLQKILRLRPLREEIEILPSAPGVQGRMRRLTDLLLPLISRQKELAELFDSWRNEYLRSHCSEEMAALLEELRKEQSLLGDSVRDLVDTEREREIPEMTLEIFEALSAAADEMKAASAAMRSASDPELLSAASRAQMMAMVRLNDALRHIRKVMYQTPPQGKEQGKKSSEDSESTSARPTDGKVRSNVLEQLDMAVSRQREAIRLFRAGPKAVSPEMNAPQSSVTAVLKLLKLRSELPEHVLTLFNVAEAASLLAERAIVSNASRTFEEQSGLALDRMLEARGELLRNSAASASSSLTYARSQAARAARRFAGKEMPLSSAEEKEKRKKTGISEIPKAGKAPERMEKEALEKAARDLESAVSNLKQASETAGESGSLENAGKLAALAEKSADAASSIRRQISSHAAARNETSPGKHGGTPGKILSDLRRTLSNAVSPEEDDAGALEEKLEKLAAEAALLKRMTPSEERNRETGAWLLETDLALEDVERNLERNRSSSDPLSYAETEKSLQKVRALTSRDWSPPGGESGGENRAAKAPPFDFQEIADELRTLREMFLKFLRSQSLPAELTLPGWDDPPADFAPLVREYFEKLSRWREQQEVTP